MKMPHPDEFEETPAARDAGGIGTQLRAARERAGLTLGQVARETRIARRYLEAIEADDFAALPGRTYAIGFSKNYAKAVGLDQGDVAEMVGAQLEASAPPERARQPAFEPGDPARVPSGRLGLISVVAVVLLLTGLFFAARLTFAPAAELPSLVEQEEQAEREAVLAATAQRASQAPQAAAADAPPSGPVIFTAEGAAWVRFYDASGRVLKEGRMEAGESYTIPAEADGPQLLTGRPDLLAITIGGERVPKLSEELVTLADIPVTAQALLARAGQDAGSGVGDEAEATPAT